LAGAKKSIDTQLPFLYIQFIQIEFLSIEYSTMPTVLRSGPYRFYFYSHDLISEPSHVHVDRDEFSAKFWLTPIALARNLGFSASELRKIERIIDAHQSELLERWDKEYGRTSW
jgi:hypothetical protein